MKKLLSAFTILIMNLVAAQVPEPVIRERNIDIRDPDFKFTEKAISDDLPNLNDEENHVYNSVLLDTKPEFPGGIESFHKAFYRQYKLPEATLKGKIYISFIVERDGSLTDIKVLRDLGSGSGKEAVRVINSLPKWVPGTIKGKTVRSLYALPIVIGEPKS
jgi:protein TonB